MVGHQELGLGCLLLTGFDHLGDVLHVDQVADLLVEEHVQDLDLDVLGLILVTGILVGI